MAMKIKVSLLKCKKNNKKNIRKPRIKTKKRVKNWRGTIFVNPHIKYGVGMCKMVKCLHPVVLNTLPYF